MFIARVKQLGYNTNCKFSDSEYIHILDTDDLITETYTIHDAKRINLKHTLSGISFGSQTCFDVRFLSCCERFRFNSSFLKIDNKNALWFYLNRPNNGVWGDDTTALTVTGGGVNDAIFEMQYMHSAAKPLIDEPTFAWGDRIAEDVYRFLVSVDTDKKIYLWLFCIHGVCFVDRVLCSCPHKIIKTDNRVTDALRAKIKVGVRVELFG